MAEAFRVFIGYDMTEDRAYKVCRESLLDHASIPLCVQRLNVDALRRAGVYRRQFYVEEGQRYDTQDGRPFSTDFSFTRFLVPALCQWEGWSLFCDSDFLWRADIAELLEERSQAKACHLVKHDYRPREERKMRGQTQQVYPRKNWSSLVLWNCEHPSTQALTPWQVSTSPGYWLHGFTWMPDGHIGELPGVWNWLEGFSSGEVEPKAVHFTRGTPDMPGHEEAAFADEWRKYAL